MASILDEYEDSLSRSASLQQSRGNVGIPHSGYVNARLEKETPIFNKQRIDFTPPEKINSLVVSCNQLCMSLGRDTLFRIDLGKADEPNQVELGRKDEARVYKMFLDHTELRSCSGKGYILQLWNCGVHGAFPLIYSIRN